MKTNLLIIALAALLSGCVIGDPNCHLDGNEHYAERMALWSMCEQSDVDLAELSQADIGLIDAALIDYERNLR